LFDAARSSFPLGFLACAFSHVTPTKPSPTHVGDVEHVHQVALHSQVVILLSSSALFFFCSGGYCFFFFAAQCFSFPAGDGVCFEEGEDDR
jgi:hypothetical protein